MRTIESSAIKFLGKIWSVPKPGRHHHVIKHILDNNPDIVCVGGVQGFLTSDNIFVGRREARIIAESANQLISQTNIEDGVPNKRTHTELFSEDVW
jgi:hypothetical protein